MRNAEHRNCAECPKIAGEPRAGKLARGVRTGGRRKKDPPYRRAPRRRPTGVADVAVPHSYPLAGIYQRPVTISGSGIAFRSQGIRTLTRQGWYAGWPWDG